MAALRGENVTGAIGDDADYPSQVGSAGVRRGGGLERQRGGEVAVCLSGGEFGKVGVYLYKLSTHISGVRFVYW